MLSNKMCLVVCQDFLLVLLRTCRTLRHILGIVSAFGLLPSNVYLDDAAGLSHFVVDISIMLYSSLPPDYFVAVAVQAMVQFS